MNLQFEQIPQSQGVCPTLALGGAGLTCRLLPQDGAVRPEDSTCCCASFIQTSQRGGWGSFPNPWDILCTSSLHPVLLNPARYPLADWNIF